ncbi:restriction endonuclease [bacterium (Candidatus Howlettbacteria) CG_4_10_14_0_8_um_filter_40_9]|nr:MAG: restriction endonuclease [bacterium (Candidatus Howlettbacteria) CG_4_10_14_0_8_um_filter_40_9]
METNILKAFHNISKLKNFKLTELYSGQNRMNNVGTALEYFVRDIFCSSIDIVGLVNKDKKHSEYLSYLGNQNNPPDFIVKNGDAIEVKKIGRLVSSIALNSSYPKSKLHSDDVRILRSCRECDGGEWVKKDIIYAVGSVTDSKIKTLWFIYGDCYAADREVYEKTFRSISKKVREVDHLDFTAETNEIAGVRKIDPLGITYLRVRDMWGIDTPHKVFGSLTEFNRKSNFSAFALMSDDKYKSFPKQDRDNIETNSKIKVKSIEIKSPNNPANYLKAKLICFVQ